MNEYWRVVLFAIVLWVIGFQLILVALIAFGISVMGYGMVFDRCWRQSFRIAHLLLLTFAISILFAMSHWDGRSAAAVILIWGWFCYWVMSRKEDRELAVRQANEDAQ